MLVADVATEMVTKTALYSYTKKVDEKASLADLLELLATHILGIETASQTKAAIQHRKNRNSVQHHCPPRSSRLLRRPT